MGPHCQTRSRWQIPEMLGSLGLAGFQDRQKDLWAQLFPWELQGLFIANREAQCGGGSNFIHPPPHPWKHPSLGGGFIEEGGQYKIPAVGGFKIYTHPPTPPSRWKCFVAIKEGGI